MAFSFFFRDIRILELAAEHAVPALVGRNRPRIWDAGCAMGAEPYSLAILLAERLGPFAWQNLRVLATDLDPGDSFGPAVTQGIYPQADVERIPEPFRMKYFEPAGEPLQVRAVEKIRSRIHFQKHDLLSLHPVGEEFTLIVCKNVLLHFAASGRVEVVRMFHRSLAPGGLLAMEQTQKLPESLAGLFERVVSDGQLYRKVAA